MMARLLLLLIVVPVVELALLVEVGRHIGTFPVILLILVTGIAGASLTRAQGLGVLRRIRHDLQESILPAESVLDGVLILVGGILLLAPGLISDAIGFALLIPASRARFKAWLGRKMKQWLEDGSIRFFIR